MERLFSTGRLVRYYEVAQHDTLEAAALYAGNIQLSESLYPALTVAEVSLRNAVHRQLTRFCSNEQWYRFLGQHKGLTDLQLALDKAQLQIEGRKETITADKVVAELTFGFWTTLFNHAYEDVLWKQLRFTFPHLPKADRQRSTVSVVINAVRNLRNRVYHNEPICWRLANLSQQHSQTLQLIQWIEPQLVDWLQPFDRFAAILQQEQARRAAYQAATKS